MEFQASLLALAFRGQNFWISKERELNLKVLIYSIWKLEQLSNTMAMIGSTQVKYSMYLTDANEVTSLITPFPPAGISNAMMKKNPRYSRKHAYALMQCKHQGVELFFKQLKTTYGALISFYSTLIHLLINLKATLKLRGHCFP